MKVKFHPLDIELEIEAGQTVLDLAQKNDVFIKSVCNGTPSCAECRVKVTEGDAFTIPPNKPELDLIGTAHYVDNSRLSCQLQCFGDITVDVTEQVEKKGKTTKNPRGFRGDQSHSKQDIVMLTEPTPVEPESKVEKSENKSEKKGENRGGGRRRLGRSRRK